MQTQQMAMAGMNANVGGPVDGTPIMGNMPRPVRPQEGFDVREKLNTYIYDYFLRNNQPRLARTMIECDVKMSLKAGSKPSPSGRNMNGVDGMDPDARDGLPEPQLPEAQTAENSFLLDWWAQFWDIYNSARRKNPNGEKSAQYITHTRNLTQMHNDQRTQRMMMASNAMGAAQYSNMIRAMPNGIGGAPNDLKRAAAMNNRNPNGGPMNMPMKSQMLSAQMQRDGSGMDMNGQRPQSPNSADNAPSPNKRQRVEGGMNPGNMPGNQFNEFSQQAQNNVQQKSLEVYAQNLAQHQRMAQNNHAMSQGMNTGMQGSPMGQQGLDGQHDLFTGNTPRTGMPPAAGQPQQGNHALQDYQMQLMLLEQQNKKRLLMARQEQDNIAGGPHGQPAVGGPGFPPSMSPQGSRAGPSPNPVDQMRKGTPKLNQQGLPGSPMPDGGLQQRGSPAPIGFDPAMPPGMPPQFSYPMQQNPMMRPPSSHPGFPGQQLTPQQMEQVRQNGGMQNGAWRGGPPAMMQQGLQQGLQQGPMGVNPQQRNQMPPPPAPAGEQPRPQEPSPSQSTQAPPTPNQANKANPKKKVTKNDKAPKAKGSGATPAASAGDEPPTPSTPVPTNQAKNFQNGQPQPQPASQPQPGPPQQHQPVLDANPPFGVDLGQDGFGLDMNFGEDNLESFDFDSFLHVGEDPTAFGSLGGDFTFGETEVAGEM